tara:strand:- start:162 stop:1055 length:894 start_codon:yes stop_codon:yes gene_type:complete
MLTGGNYTKGVETEFEKILAPQLAKLWERLYAPYFDKGDGNFENSVQKRYLDRMIAWNLDLLRNGNSYNTPPSTLLRNLGIDDRFGVWDVLNPAPVFEYNFREILRHKLLECRYLVDTDSLYEEKMKARGALLFNTADPFSPLILGKLPAATFNNWEYSEKLSDDYDGEDWEELFSNRSIRTVTTRFATDLVMESQSEMLSYFSPGWTSTMTGLPSVVFEAIQENVPTSDANDAYRALIEATCGLQEFIEAAIDADGWENFLPGSDGGLVGEYRDYFHDGTPRRDFLVWRDETNVEW